MTARLARIEKDMILSLGNATQQDPDNRSKTRVYSGQVAPSMLLSIFPPVVLLHLLLLNE